MFFILFLVYFPSSKGMQGTTTAFANITVNNLKAELLAEQIGN